MIASFFFVTSVCVKTSRKHLHNTERKGWKKEMRLNEALCDYHVPSIENNLQFVFVSFFPCFE